MQRRYSFMVVLVLVGLGCGKETRPEPERVATVPSTINTDAEAMVTKVTVVQQGVGVPPAGLISQADNQESVNLPQTFWAVVSAEIPTVKGPQGLPPRFVVGVRIGKEDYPCEVFSGAAHSLVILRSGLSAKPGPYSLRVYDGKEAFLKMFPIAKLAFASRILQVPAASTATYAGTTFDVTVDRGNLRVRTRGSGTPGKQLAIRLLRSSYEPAVGGLGQRVGTLVPIGKTNQDAWIPAHYPGQIDAVQVEVQEVSQAHVHTLATFPNVSLKDDHGQPTLATDNPSIAKLPDGIELKLYSNDPEVKSAARLRKFVKAGLVLSPEVVGGQMRLVTPQLADLGVGLFFEQPTLRGMGYGGSTSTWNQSVAKLNTQPIPPQDPPRPRYGPIHFSMDVDLSYWKIVNRHIIDLAVPNNPFRKTGSPAKG